ncbi:MAG: DUF1080 domain-containing protein [Bacteroidales bacterium]|nr:DUF1080 domain-containing protein [Bacteroidales bacterium]
MKRLSTFVLIACVGAFTLNAQEWVELFNGKNLKGWEKLDGKAEYRVENGEIIGVSKTGTPNTFVATKKVYGDFILEYEMKMDRGLNSGVQFRSIATKPDGTERVNGYQVECDDHDNRPWAGGIYEEADRGWLYPMSYNQCAAKVNKRGEWNHVRIEAVGSTIRTYINGTNFANLVDDARSEGFIALQIHGINDAALDGKEIRWKNIRILIEDPEKYMKSDASLAQEVSYLTNDLTAQQREEGWKLLWDGKTTKGWRGANLDHFPEKGWDISEGVLSVEKSGGGESAHGGDIVTIKKYKSFILEVDLKITEGANSGIKYFVDPDLNTGAGSAIGCEFQILDDKNHPDAKNGISGNRTLASLYDLIEADAYLYGQDNRKKRFNGVGKWNRARIEVKGSKVSHYLNGVKVIEYERGTQMWKALVAYSKYSKWPAFGEAESGHILLQDHGDEVSFKNIRIRELD